MLKTYDTHPIYFTVIIKLKKSKMFAMTMWLLARYKVIPIPLSVFSSDTAFGHTKDSLKVVRRREILLRDKTLQTLKVLQTPPNYHLSLWLKSKDSKVLSLRNFSSTFKGIDH